MVENPNTKSIQNQPKPPEINLKLNSKSTQTKISPNISENPSRTQLKINPNPLENSSQTQLKINPKKNLKPNPTKAHYKNKTENPLEKPNGIARVAANIPQSCCHCCWIHRCYLCRRFHRNSSPPCVSMCGFGIWERWRVEEGDVEMWKREREREGRRLRWERWERYFNGDNFHKIIINKRIKNII